MSKLFLYDFQCKAGHSFEDLQDPADKPVLPCPACGEEARRVISAVRLDYTKMAMQSGFPTAVDKWERKQKQRLKKEKDDPNLLMY